MVHKVSAALYVIAECACPRLCSVLLEIEEFHGEGGESQLNFTSKAFLARLTLRKIRLVPVIPNLTIINSQNAPFYQKQTFKNSYNISKYAH